MPVGMLQFSRIETYVGNMHICLFISSKTSQIYKSWSLHGFFNNSNCCLLRPQKWSRRRSDPHDVTDWYTDYMLCKTYCVIHCADKIQVSLKNCSKCLCTIDFATIYMYNPRDIHLITRHSVYQDSNTATCKFIVSVVGRSPYFVNRLSASFNHFSTNDC